MTTTFTKIDKNSPPSEVANDHRETEHIIFLTPTTAYIPIPRQGWDIFTEKKDSNHELTSLAPARQEKEHL